MFSNKNIVITGCLSGIGKQTLIKFAQNGADIVACAYERQNEFDELCKTLSKDYKVNLTPLYFDLANIESVKNAGKILAKEKKEIHGIVNVAGIARDALFQMMTYSDLIDTFKVNVFSQLIFSQYIIKNMIRTKTRGSVVFTSSMTALDGNRGQTAYGASKAALIGAVKSMAAELGLNGIRVNAVCPGVINSHMRDKLAEEILNEKLKAVELKRIGEASEVADLYMFLISDLSSHITGQSIRIDGGIGT